jgi:ADP-ribose pyrophosphatase YjhB (NUDIX family)
VPDEEASGRWVETEPNVRALTLVHDEGLDASLSALERHAVRAVVVRDGEVLMMRASSGALKFPGGGVEHGESDEDALRREVDEETGMAVTSVDGYVGAVVERSAAQPGDAEPVFVQVSRYYRCQVGPGAGRTALTAAERELGLGAVRVPIAEAVATNRALVGGPHRFVRRELAVLELLSQDDTTC